MQRIRSLHRQRGVTLIESLVAFAVVAVGTVSVLRLQRDLRFNADLSSQRAEASHLGQQAMERQRAAGGFESSPTPSSSLLVAGRNTSFTVASAGNGLALAPSSAATASVAVSWPDSTGTARSVILESLVSPASPTLSAALAIRPIDASVARLEGRAASLPVDLKDLGNGTSAWKPNTTDRTVWVFDNVSGRIVSRCLSASSSARTDDLTLADLSLCSVARSTLLSGIVRTSLATPPESTGANDPPQPMQVVLDLSVPAQAGSPECVVEVDKSVEAVFGSGVGAVVQREAVAVDATAATLGAASLRELGDRFVTYRCVVPDPPGGWSGRSSVLPAASSPPNGTGSGIGSWSIGTTATDRKVCRFVQLPSGTAPTAAPADPNAAHPATYTGVDESLTQQNFLIVRGDQACPGAVPGSLTATAQQQP